MLIHEFPSRTRTRTITKWVGIKLIWATPPPVLTKSKLVSTEHVIHDAFNRFSNTKIRQGRKSLDEVSHDDGKHVRKYDKEYGIKILLLVDDK